MTYSVKKIAAFLLALAMMINLLPAGVLAEDYNKNSDPIEINLTKGGGAKNASGIPLTSVASVAVDSITSGGEPIVSGQTIERDQEIGINVSFSIPNNQLQTAKENTPWTISLADYCGDGAIFSSLLANPNGALIDKTESDRAGSYVVNADGTILLYPDAGWFKDKTDVMGSFTITAQLNETVNSQINSNSFVFPGTSESTVNFLPKEIEADKYAKRYNGDTVLNLHAATDENNTTATAEPEDGAEVTVIDAGDGSYRLFYRVRVQVNCKPNEQLQLIDRLTGGQVLTPDTVEVYVEDSNGTVNVPVTVEDLDDGGEGFKINLKAALTAKFPDPSDYVGKDIWVEYYTTLTEDNVRILHDPATAADASTSAIVQRNEAQVLYDGNDLRPATEVKPKYVKKVSPYKQIGNEEGIYYPITGTSESNEMALGQRGEVHFLTGGQLSSPAASLTVTDNATGVEIIEDSIKINIGPDSNGEFFGYVDYKHWTASSALLSFDETNRSGFTFDVHKFIKYLVENSEHYHELYKNLYIGSGANFKLKAGTEFKVYYKANVLSNYMPGTNNAVSNTATWNAYDNPEPAEVSTKLTSDTTEIHIDKDVYRRYSNGTTERVEYEDDGDMVGTISAGNKVHFELDVYQTSVDGSYMNLAGKTVTDTIQNFIKALPEDIEIFASGTNIATYHTSTRTWNPDAGFTIQLADPSKIGIAKQPDGAATAAESIYKSYDLFTITFPSGAGVDCSDKYTIAYDVVIDDVMPEGDSLYGTGNYTVTNTGTVGIIGTPEASVTKKVNAWYDFPKIEKKFVSWDKAKNEAVWEILVTLPDGIDKIEQEVRIYESIYKMAMMLAENGAGTKHPSLDAITFEVFSQVTGEKMQTGEDQINRYIVQKSGAEANVIFRKGISEDIRIVVHMGLSPSYILAEQLEMHAQNEVTLYLGPNSNTVSATGDYYDTDFEFEKTGDFSSAAEEAQNGEPAEDTIKWEVQINPDGKHLMPDFKPVFKDTIPDGLIRSTSIRVTGYWENTQAKAFMLKINPTETTGPFTLNLIDLISANWDTDAIEKYTPFYTYDKPVGLSGWHFKIEYSTILTDAKKQEIIQAQKDENLKNYPFTNHAEIYIEDGDTPLKTDSATVKYRYEDIVRKEDVSAESGGAIQLLSYKVTINPEKKKINDGNWVTLTDEIPTQMTLMLSSVTVKDENGEVISGTDQCSVSYSDVTRRLEISLPDETKATVFFDAIPNRGNGTYENTVVLSGTDFSQTDTVTKDHRVNSAGTLQGTSNAVQIKKVDKYSINTTLQGAEFEFYECSVNPSTGEITGETKTRELTSNSKGMLTFSPVKSNTLYYWKEINPPTGYEIASSVPHYFVVYQELNTSNKITVPWNRLNSATREAIQYKFNATDYPSYTLIRNLTETSTTSVYIKAYGPSSGQEDEYNSNQYCYLSSAEYPSGTTGYESLMEEVNAVSKQEADDLDDLVTDYYGGQKIVASIVSGYSWQVENIKSDVTSVQFEATKTLTGRDMDKDEFTFELYNETVEDDVHWLQTQTSPAGADGEAATVRFDKLSYTTPGVYKYRIEEIAGNAKNVTYDNTIYHIVVTVVRDENEGSQTYGKLNATVTSMTKTQGASGTPEDVTDKSIAFANTYTQPAGELMLPGTKTLTGRSMSKGEFNFTVKEGDTTVSTGSSAAAADGQPGKITFKPIKYTTTGTHTYTVMEDTTNLPFVTQTGTPSYTVEVEVKEDPANAGSLKAEITSITPNDNSGSSSIAFTNEYRVPVTKLEGQKKWLDGLTSHDNANLITLELYRYINGGKPELYTLSQVQWTGDTFKYQDLPAKDNDKNDYTYYVIESGFTDEISGKYITTYSNTGSTVTDKVLDGGTITNKKLTSVSGTKTWDDSNDQDGKRPDSVTVQLYADGTAVSGKTAMVSGTNLSYGWTDLPMCKDDGTPIAYTVKEDGETNGKLAGKNGAEYTVDYTDRVVNADGSTTANITNTYENPKIDVSVTKDWDDDDNRDNKRPDEVTFTLYANGTAVDNSEITLDGTADEGTAEFRETAPWIATWSGLDEKNAGETIVYTVKETSSDAKYTVDYGKDAQENALTVAVDGGTITNKHTPEKISIKATKAWDDSNNQDGKRDAVTLVLSGTYKDSSNQVQTVNLTDAERTIAADAAGDDLTVKWEDLYRYINGCEITYTVTEKNTATAEGKTTITLNGAVYGVEVTGNVEDGFTVTNSYTPGTTGIAVTKAWDDDDNRDGVRPETVTFTLYADDKAVDNSAITLDGTVDEGTAEFRETAPWIATWSGLDEKNAGETIVYTVKETSSDAKYTVDYGKDAQENALTVAVDGGTITNKHTPEKISIKATKAWDDSNNQDGKRDAVTLVLSGTYKDSSNQVQTVNLTDAERTIAADATGDDLTVKWEDLYEYENGCEITYTVTEKNAVTAENKTTITLNGAVYGVEVTGNADDGFTVTNSYKPGKTDFTATKTWVDEGNAYDTRPASLALTLMKQLEGETEATAVENAPVPTVTKNDDNTWTYTWTELQEKENGKTITYSAVEEAVPAGYARSNETANAVTNTWKTGEDTVHDHVSVYKEDNARNQLKGAVFTLYKADTCKEDDKIKTYSGETFTIDTEDKDLEQYLLADESKPTTLYLKETKAPEGYVLDETVYSVVITADVSDPEYDKDEDEFITTTTYAVTINGKTSINIPNAKTYVKLSKVDATTEEELGGATIQIIDSEGNVVVEWVSEAGKPLEVTGLKTGEEYTLHETAAPNGYLVTSDTKFVIDENGKVSGTATVSVDENGIQTLLVEDAMKKLSAVVKKVWDDDNDRDALRPDSITARLLQNGETYATISLNAQNNWTYMVKDLPAVDGACKDYVYEWEETDAVEGYTSTKKTEGVLTVLTNTHGPEETAVKVTKAWNDNDDAAEKRPAGIKVQLYADGQAAGEPVELNAANGWTVSWDHLVKNANRDGQAKPIVYTVAETEVPKGYTSRITGSMAAGYVITNTMETGSLIIEKQFDIQVPEKEEKEEEMTTDIEVVKIWEDNNNRDGNRPASITVHLYAGGKEVKSAQLTADGGWRKKFGGLPKFVDGHPIRYSVTEDPVEWYVPEIRGFTITNRYTPEVTSLTVRKVWNDDGDKRKIRPLSVAMKLNNGTIVILSEENGWTATVTGLPTRVNGKPAEYYWTEQSVLGYVQESVETKGTVTVFTNKLWTSPDGPSVGKKPKTYGETLYHMEDYDTPLGVNVVINHVGDCFD